MSNIKTDYYPTKMTVISDRPVSDFMSWIDDDWQSKAERLQERRWRKVHATEKAEKQEKSYLRKISQRKWLQRHGWPHVAQPMV